MNLRTPRRSTSASRTPAAPPTSRQSSTRAIRKPTRSSWSSPTRTATRTRAPPRKWRTGPEKRPFRQQTRTDDESGGAASSCFPALTLRRVKSATPNAFSRSSLGRGLMDKSPNFHVPSIPFGPSLGRPYGRKSSGLVGHPKAERTGSTRGCNGNGLSTRQPVIHLIRRRFA